MRSYSGQAPLYSRPSGPLYPRPSSPLYPRGQASIMIALLILTFILFFAFVVNTGTLINAKINLQNAADMAAYSGAATQARQLNHIAYLNYEMRRQYKKFLYRYYVVAGMTQQSLYGSKGELRAWSPDTDPGHDFKVPAVCIIWDTNDNFCRVFNLPAIKIPRQALLDRINETLREGLLKLEAKREKNCLSIGDTNSLILKQWLWNTDPDYQYLLKSFTGDLQKIADIIQGVAHGLGLIPRELILKKRIETLADSVNFPAQKTVNFDKARTLSNTGDIAAHERVIQAFFSAYNSLGTHAFPSADIQLDELLPGELIRLKPITLGFDAYSVNFQLKENGKDPKDPKDCESFAQITTIPDKVPVGFVKDPTKLTYYAVRLKAKAHLLLSPFGDIDLRAYAAAQPFGSRISPPLQAISSTDFLKEALGKDIPSTLGGIKGTIPNLAVQIGDTPQKGWSQNFVIRSMFEQLKNCGGAGAGGAKSDVITIDQGTLESCYQMGMVPNPFEAGKYNIINDLVVDDPFDRNFDEEGIYAFWAPVISYEKTSRGGSADSEIREMIDELLKPPLGGSATFKPEYKTELMNGIAEYFKRLREGQGENGEGFNIAILVDPFKTRPTASKPSEPIKLSEDIFLNDPKKLKTSWNDVKDGSFVSKGRSGYSVKIVAFKTLMQRAGGSTTDGSEKWNNFIPTDADMKGNEFDLIEH